MMERVLEGKVALITGAAGGIGRESALLFAAQGAAVAVVDVDRPVLQETLRLIEDAGGRGLGLPAELTQADEVEAAVLGCVSGLGRLDILFNVAGASGRRWGDGPTADCSEDAWDRVLAVNLKSQFLTCKYALPEMIRMGGGSIVNLSSVLGLVGGDEDFATHAYAASKGGIISLTRAIAAYYARDRVRANVLCPGLIRTPMSQRAQTNPAIRSRLPRLQPLTGDFGQPEDVAHAALFLASDQAKFITGAVLTVDGGWTVV
ncbi:MAG: SDR family oxidoreductase [Chloroflexi bacterium]|nr:SDR family oxidoreductase [Chloroflexota bacterium]